MVVRTEVLLMPLAARLRQARQETGLTQQRVAELTRLEPNSIWRYEAGQREPSASTLNSLAALYGKPMEWFLSDDEPEPAGTDLDADRELLMNEVDLAFRAVSNELSDEAIRSIADYIRFVHEREERQRRESQG